MGLDDRKKLILKAVVDDYIATSEPVGSKTVVNNHGIQLSSATVRHIMADLEQSGYLIQPHTSAGRVPSDKGYRAYVDSLMDVPDLPPDERQTLALEFQDGMTEIQPLLKKAVSVLSETTGYTAIAVAPYASESHLKQLKILMIEPGRALMVVVMSEGLVKNRVARVPHMLSLEQLIAIAETVEQGVAGLRLEDITLVTIETSAQGIELPDSLLNQVLYEAYVSIKQAENLELYTDGITNIFKHPDFRDVSQASAFANLIGKEGGMIVGRMNPVPPPEAIKAAGQDDPLPEEEAVSRTDSRPYPDYFMIRIGQEIAIEALENCSFVTTTYQQGSRMLGNISVVGPKWMSYRSVISRIGFVREAVQRQLEPARLENDRSRSDQI